jgi:hypothetical protein
LRCRRAAPWTPLRLAGFGWRAIHCGRDVSRHDRQSALLSLTIKARRFTLAGFTHC